MKNDIHKIDENSFHIIYDLHEYNVQIRDIGEACIQLI